MELNEMKSIRQAYDSKLERSLKLNLHCLEMIQSQKVKRKLKPLFWGRIIEAIIQAIVIIWLGNFFINHFSEIKFAIAALLLLSLFIMSFVNCIHQMILLTEINYTEDIVTIQKKLTLLQSRIVFYISLTFICLPTYLAYPIIFFKAIGNFDISKINPDWWLANLLFSIVILPVCIWLFNQVSYKNFHKKWVRFIIQKSAGTRVTTAMEFIKEMDELKKKS